MSVRRKGAMGVALLSSLALLLAACSSDPSTNESPTGNGNGSGNTQSPDGDPFEGLGAKGAMADYDVGVQFTATEPVTFSHLFSDHPNYPLSDDWLLLSEITERTNVTLDNVLVPMSDYEQKRAIMIGAGEAPYIITKTYPGQEQQFVASGALLAISDYVHLMPNFSKKVEDWNLTPNIDTLRQEDGKYYVLPGLHEIPSHDYTLAMRIDVLDDLGLESPTTWEELRTVLEAIKAEYPDSYPLSDRFQGGSLLNVASLGFGAPGGWGYNNAQYDASSGEFVYAGTSPEQKAMVEYFAGLVADGLMDPESFTQDDDTAIQKFANGRSFAISTNSQNIVNDYRPALENNISDAVIAKIEVPGGPLGHRISSYGSLENGIMFSSKAAQDESFVAMLQFVDWLWYSDEGQEFAKWGVEGVTYDVVDGKRVLNSEIDMVGLNPGAPKHLQKDYGFSGGVFAYGGTADLVWSMFSEEEVEFRESTRSYDVIPLDPQWPLNEAERDQLTLLDTPLKDAAQTAQLAFITGTRPLSEWDNWVAEAEAAGASQFIDMVNTAADRFAEQNG